MVRYFDLLSSTRTQLGPMVDLADVRIYRGF